MVCAKRVSGPRTGARLGGLEAAFKCANGGVREGVPAVCSAGITDICSVESGRGHGMARTPTLSGAALAAPGTPFKRRSRTRWNAASADTPSQRRFKTATLRDATVAGLSFMIAAVRRPATELNPASSTWSLRDKYIAFNVAHRSLVTSWSKPCIGRAYTPLPPVLAASFTTRDEPLSRMGSREAELATGFPLPARPSSSGDPAASYICCGGR